MNIKILSVEVETREPTLCIVCIMSQGDGQYYGKYTLTLPLPYIPNSPNNIVTVDGEWGNCYRSVYLDAGMYHKIFEQVMAYLSNQDYGKIRSSPMRPREFNNIKVHGVKITEDRLRILFTMNNDKKHDPDSPRTCQIILSLPYIPNSSENILSEWEELGDYPRLIGLETEIMGGEIIQEMIAFVAAQDYGQIIATLIQKNKYK